LRQRDGSRATLDGQAFSTVQVESCFANESEFHLLRFFVGRVRLHCHFFTVSEIEFDFDPRGTSETDITKLAEFMAEIGDMLDKTVVLTPENVSVEPIYRYDPKTRTVTYVRR
jgi:hypothetical protein